MDKCARTHEILLVIHDFGGEADVDDIASRLEADQPDLEPFLQILEEEGLVEQLLVLCEMEVFHLTKKGRRRLAGNPLPVKSVPSRWINPKTGRPRLDWDKE